MLVHLAQGHIYELYTSVLLLKQTGVNVAYKQPTSFEDGGPWG